MWIGFPLLRWMVERKIARAASSEAESADNLNRRLLVGFCLDPISRSTVLEIELRWW
jgi:hypothetical protein